MKEMFLHKMKTRFCERLIKYFAWKNYLGQSAGGSCLGIREAIIQAPNVRGNFSGGHCLGSFIRGAIILGGNCPGDNCPETAIVWETIIPGEIVRREIVRRGIVLKPKTDVIAIFSCVYKHWMNVIVLNYFCYWDFWQKHLIWSLYWFEYLTIESAFWM